MSAYSVSSVRLALISILRRAISVLRLSFSSSRACSSTYNSLIHFFFLSTVGVYSSQLTIFFLASWNSHGFTLIFSVASALRTAWGRSSSLHHSDNFVNSVITIFEINFGSSLTLSLYRGCHTLSVAMIWQAHVSMSFILCSMKCALSKLLLYFPLESTAKQVSRQELRCSNSQWHLTQMFCQGCAIKWQLHIPSL